MQKGLKCNTQGITAVQAEEGDREPLWQPEAWVIEFSETQQNGLERTLSSPFLGR